MIISGKEIKKQVEQGRIHISPFIEEHINPNSYNYRLHEDLLEILDLPIDPKREPNLQKIKIGEEGYVLQPGKLYLGSTVEEIGSDYYVTSLIGRSSVGRLGLFLQITADLGHVGAKHRWTLELKVVQPLIVYPLMKIGQVSFWTVEGNLNHLYNGKYAKYSEAHCSELHQEFGQIR
jgi:dCTP deaminase